MVLYKSSRVPDRRAIMVDDLCLCFHHQVPYSEDWRSESMGGIFVASGSRDSARERGDTNGIIVDSLLYKGYSEFADIAH